MTDQPIPPLLVLLLNILIPIIAMGVLRVSAERLWPIEAPRKTSDAMNLAAFLIWFPIGAAFGPLATAFGIFLTNHLGGGFIALPDHGWGLAGGFIVYFLVMDLSEYLYHRAQHVYPWLWSMHSLHHSDRTFDSTTSALHHWLPPLIKTFFVSIPLGLVFKAPWLDLIIYTNIGYYAFLIHANVRLDFGRFAWLLNSPSFHRVHHSALEEHFDCNYASVLPIFDVMFGSYRPARPGEWPPVGLGDRAEAKSLFDLAFWPVRERIRAWIRRRTGRRIPAG